ncbi:hypothetical protein Q0N12_10380 [Rossellomorea marisflavi]|uniref:hypothetical protein n=1 Tax=Rossellomorea marisflavi TaxID=189381 RepID=UPI003459C009
MKRKKILAFSKIPLITFITSLLVLFTMLPLQSQGRFIYIGTPPNGLSHLLIANNMIAVASGSLLYMIKDKAITVINVVVGAFFIIIPSFPILMADTTYTTFSSPSGMEHFVVVVGGGNRLYQLSDSRLYMTYLTSIPTDDAYKPFSSGDYEVEWNAPNQLVIHYAFDYLSDTLVKKIPLPYKVQ